MYIKMNEDKSLMITVPTTIYRGEKNSDLITFLIPGEYEGNNIADYKMTMRYILPSGLGRSEELVFQPEMYKSYLQYSTQLNSRFTEERGEITIWLTAFGRDGDIVLKTGEVAVTISQSKDISAYLPPNELDQIDQLAAKVAELEAKKADGLSYDEAKSVVYLTRGGIPIQNSEVYVCMDDNNAIVGAELSELGELIVSYEDGTTKNLGKVKAEDGAVYVPHMSPQKVLSWTVEQAPGEIPAPVDLNPNDEWGSVDGSETVTEYVWESL